MARLAEPGRALLGEGILTGGQLLGGHGRATLYKLKFVPKLLPGGMEEGESLLAVDVLTIGETKLLPV